MSTRWVRFAGIALALMSISLIPRLAGAVEAGFYVGGNYGQSDTTLDIAPFDALAQAVNTAFFFAITDRSSTLEDGKDTTYSFFGGYRFSRHWAVEAGYMDFGKRVYREQSIGNYLFDEADEPPRTHELKLSSHSTGLTVSGLGILPLSYRSELFARGGISYVQNNVEIRGPYSAALRGGGATSFLAGVGGSFTFADIYAVRLEFQRAFDIGHPKMQKADVDMITLGIAVTF
jgi:hypothetical protein